MSPLTHLFPENTTYMFLPRYNVFILSLTLTKATQPHVSLYLSDTTQPFAQYHLFFTSTFTFFHPPNLVLLCLNLYHSLPFYVLSLCGLPVRNQNSRFILWCYTLFKILYFSAGPSRTSDTGGHLDRV